MGSCSAAHPHLAAGPHADVLRHLCDQGQPVQRRLINAAHLVVHKQAGQQHRQGEDLRAVLSRLQASTAGEASSRMQPQEVGQKERQGRLLLLLLARGGAPHLIIGVNALRVQQHLRGDTGRPSGWLLAGCCCKQTWWVAYNMVGVAICVRAFLRGGPHPQPFGAWPGGGAYLKAPSH